MVRPLASSLVIAAALVPALAGVAAARPTVRLAVDGECPSGDQLRDALSAWVDVSATEGEWTIAVTEREHVAELALRDRAGATALSRRLVSRDCNARAEAFAVMIHAHFVELRLLPMPAPVAPQPAPEPPPPSRAPALTLDPPPTTDEARAAPVLRRTVGPPRVARTRVVSIGASGGVDVAGTTKLSEFGQIDASWFRSSWLVFAALTLDAPITVEAPSDRIELWRVMARGGIGRRFDLGWTWVQPMLGAGVAAWHVDPLDLMAASTHWRFQPIATAAAALGVPLTSWLALRLEASGTLFLVRDRYLIDPQGEIARSPRGAFALGVGLEFGVIR